MQAAPKSRQIEAAAAVVVPQVRVSAAREPSPLPAVLAAPDLHHPSAEHRLATLREAPAAARAMLESPGYVAPETAAVAQAVAQAQQRRQIPEAVVVLAVRIAPLGSPSLAATVAPASSSSQSHHEDSAMNIYTLPDSTTVKVTDQFQIGNQKYPPGWLWTASPAALTALGITVQTVADPVAPFSTAPAAAAVAASYAAGLRRKAARLKAQGDTQGSVDLLLQAAGITQ
jgi:hypothetical protein